MLQTLSFRPQAGKHAVLITDGGCKPDNNYGFAAVGEESAQTAASKKLAEAGVSNDLAKRLGGWTQDATVQRYDHADKTEEIRQALESTSA